MTDRPMISILGAGLCIPDQSLAESLGFTGCALNPVILPPLMRRRTSQATRMAVTAAGRACDDAAVDTDMPAIFVSAVGEMQITDRLCQAIAQQSFPLSPTQFHNSVHNTAAGYWSIAIGSMHPMQAMGGMQDGFALGLLEAWCQINMGVQRLLLVCYDESMPEALLPDYHWQPCAMALVLGAEQADRPSISMPWQVSTESEDHRSFNALNPAFEALPLLQALQCKERLDETVEVCSGPSRWISRLVSP
ncbi:MAG: beta-ketoacyl synthase chain length factor [Candidatus Thiodiazotropha sp. (ex Rostrolucina anterorostrata)]|nr:beta-ketoacyl synthase chain length factor [Candidatus Thiodiazotropha sp. (ex Rostrolucina anterorostrata)]